MASHAIRHLAVLKKPRRIGDAMLKFLEIVSKIGNNPSYFPSPSPALAIVSGHLDDLKDAETLAVARHVGAAAARDVVYTTVLRDMNLLLDYVQTCADHATNPTLAEAIIASSGFHVKIKGVKNKYFVARNGKISGTVHLITRAVARRAAYEWQMSTDGVNWIHLPATLEAKTTAKDLTATVRYHFRYRPVLKKSEGVRGWSQAVTLVVT